MRARNIKPAFWENEGISECSHAARLLFIALWCMADRLGRLERRPKRISALAFPYDGIDVEPLLEELAAVFDMDGKPAFIELYEANGMRYLQIVNFRKHQRPHQNEKPSEIPAREMDQSTCDQGAKHFALNEERGMMKEEAGSGDTSPTESANADPLSPFSDLSAFYGTAHELLHEAHPGAKIPKPGSKQDRKSRDTFSKLIRLDNFTERDVIGCLTWVFTSEDADAEFWRGNVHALAPLRAAKNGATKFAKIHEAWTRATRSADSTGADVDPAISAAIDAIMKGGNS